MATQYAGSDAPQVCAFCHTPNGERGVTPTWQRNTASDNDAFPTYASVGSTSRGTAAELGSVSIACLSCHDGTQAVNVTGYPFSIQSPHGLDDSGRPEPRIGTRPPTAINLGASHPVGVPYLGDSPGSRRTVSVASVDGPIAVREFRIGFRTADSAMINGVPVWWVETGEPGRQRDDIHLFSRDSNDGSSEPYVECSSCHDPHLKSRMFLRHTEPAGFICVTCHIM